jgi:hypothetical protein
MTALAPQMEVSLGSNDDGRYIRATGSRKWNPSELPDWLNEKAYRREILPRLSKFTVKPIRLALDVSHPYATKIRRGTTIPHARHWVKLANLAGISHG